MGISLEHKIDLITLRQILGNENVSDTKLVSRAVPTTGTETTEIDFDALFADPIDEAPVVLTPDVMEITAGDTFILKDGSEFTISQGMIDSAEVFESELNKVLQGFGRKAQVAASDEKVYVAVKATSYDDKSHDNYKVFDINNNTLDNIIPLGHKRDGILLRSLTDFSIAPSTMSKDCVQKICPDKFEALVEAVKEAHTNATTAEAAQINLMDEIDSGDMEFASAQSFIESIRSYLNAIESEAAAKKAYYLGKIHL